MNNFIIVDHLEDLDLESKYLTHKAKDATGHAYAPYSKFLVGAAVLLEDGTIVTGTNQENAAYPSGMCAERVALFAAAALHPEKKITKIAVVAKRKGGKETLPATSCGPCRQVMLEFEQRQEKLIEVIMQNQEHKWVKAPSAESLLPFSFTKASLEHHEKH
ncbi:cytidine deaminase [Fulvivirgaceae bacterium PWU4]|uniref:Cytidine deaminase n=1 Tax=Chryseosolibacter histidini TaxID=2782349 RepID=A0AAP2GLY1_9BACT|nr:cytidine deaminase [Chryseosolibacter histidini]MBT1696323.1 cytidine deaminase [Chryseosolibacter histidini]